jgi:hypothetical protein
MATLFKSLFLMLLGSVALISCRSSKGYETLIFRFEEPPTQINARWVNFVLETPRPDITQPIEGAQVVIGDRVYPATLSKTGRFTWRTLKGCEELPQGKNIVAKYEMFNKARQILQTKSVTLTEIDNC